MRAEQHAAERRRRKLWISGGVAIALVVIVAASIGIYRSTSSVTATASHAPAHTTSDYGYVVEADSPDTAEAEAPRVVAYEDFLCPYCAQFESESGAWLLKQAQAGAIVLEYRPIAFLDQNSTTDYSTRAADAAACVADDAGTDAFTDMHQALFARQAAEGSAGLTDDQLGPARDQRRSRQRTPCPRASTTPRSRTGSPRPPTKPATTVSPAPRPSPSTAPRSHPEPSPPSTM